jgi:hypothetical protein
MSEIDNVSIDCVKLHIVKMVNARYNRFRDEKTGKYFCSYYVYIVEGRPVVPCNPKCAALLDLKASNLHQRYLVSSVWYNAYNSSCYSSYISLSIWLRRLYVYLNEGKQLRLL